MRVLLSSFHSSEGIVELLQCFRKAWLLDSNVRGIIREGTASACQANCAPFLFWEGEKWEKEKRNLKPTEGDGYILKSGN